MKRKLVAFLATFLTVFSAFNIKAYSSEKISNTNVIAFSDIKDIMLENSIDMKIADNNLKDSKQEVDKINDEIEDLGYKPSNLSSTISKLKKELKSKGIEDSDDVKEANEKISRLESKLNGEDTENSAEINSQLSSLKSALEDYNTLTLLQSYQQKRKTAQRNYKKTELNYRQTVEKAVYEAEKSYVQCLGTVSKIDNSKKKTEYDEKKINIYKLQYESGFISKKEYEDAVRNNVDSKNDLIETETNQETALNNLKSALGIDIKEDISLSNDITKDLQEVTKINYEEDLDEMLENSINITIADLELQWAKDNDDDNDDDYENYSLENKALSLDKQYITSEIDFKQKYYNLMNAYNSIKSSYDKLQQSQEDYVTASRKYSYGFITKNELEKTEIELEEKMSDFNNERNEFYLKYLDYNQMKEGY